jgi:hypothetical protein
MLRQSDIQLRAGNTELPRGPRFVPVDVTHGSLNRLAFNNIQVCTVHHHRDRGSRQREALSPNELVLTNDRGAFERIVQFSDIAGPLVPEEGLRRRGRQLRTGMTDLTAQSAAGTTAQASRCPQAAHAVAEFGCRIRSIWPGFACWAPVERAALESKQLRLEQRLGKRRAIDPDEPAAPARRGAVDEPRYDFLPHTRLTLEARRGVSRGDLARFPQHIAPTGRSANCPVSETDVVDERIEVPLANAPFHASIGGGTRVAHAHNRTHGPFLAAYWR